jgi:ABC-type uncharacterized transport system auxiliary subunit
MSTPLRRVSLIFAAALAGAILPACGSGLRSGEPPIVSYLLRAPAAEAITTKPLAYSLMVLVPITQPGLAQDGIALVTADSRLDRYAGSRWTDTLPRVVSALAVHTLRGSGAIATVSDDAAPFAADYLLRIDVTHFEARYAGARADSDAAPTVQLRFECAIARRSDRVVVSSFVAEASEAAASNRMAEVIAAFDRATQAALIQLRQHTLETLAGQPRTP